MDPAALAVRCKTRRYLGIGIANLVNILNPELVVLGGLGAGERPAWPDHQRDRQAKQLVLHAALSIVPSLNGG